MELSNLVAQRNELQKQLGAINSQINDYSDGFKYVVIIHSYGSHIKRSYTNLVSAIAECNEYYEDNGFAYLFTNNPNTGVVDVSGGEAFFIEDVDSVSQYSVRPEACRSLSSPRLEQEITEL